MKNTYSRFIIVAIFLVASFFTVTLTSSAQTPTPVPTPTNNPSTPGGGGGGGSSPACPVGYICVPPCPSGTPCPIPACPIGYACSIVTENCPTGYTCHVHKPGIPVPTSDATITVTGSPSLALKSANGKETELVATFNFSVDGKKEGVNIYVKGGAYVSFNNATGNTSSYRGAALTALGAFSTIRDENGELLIIVKPGQIVKFQAIAKVEPTTMIAGAYKATLNLLYAAPYTTGHTVQSSDGFKLIAPPNLTNSKTIVGEVSPYITEISPTVLAAGTKVTLKGTKMNGTKLYIDGVLQSIPLTITATSVKFTMPTLSPGWHYLYLNKSTTGASNNYGFEIAGPPPSLIDLTVGRTGEMPGTYSYLYMVRYDSTKIDPSSVDLSFSCAATVSGKIRKTDGTYKEVCGTVVRMEHPQDGYYTLGVTYVNTSSTTAGVINARAHANPGTTSVSYDSAQVVIPASAICDDGSVCTSNATAQVTTQTLNIEYDAFQKEVLLRGTYDVSVDGGTTGVYIYQYGGGQVFVDQNGNRSGANSQQSQGLTPVNVVPVVTLTDSYGQTLYVVPAGKHVKFSGSTTIDPRQMFAGTYHAEVVSLWANPNTTDISNAFKLAVPANQSNTKTIVGETSPYISSVTNPIKVGDTMIINGRRLQNSIIYIDGTERDPTSVVRSTDGTVISFPLPTLTLGYHSLYLKNTNGESNQAYFEVMGEVTPYSLTITSPTTGTVWQTGSEQIMRWNMIQTQDPHIPKVITVLSKLNGTGQVNISAQQDGIFPYLGSYPTGTDFSGVKVNIPNSPDFIRDVIREHIRSGKAEYQVTLMAADATPTDFTDNAVMSQPVTVNLTTASSTTTTCYTFIVNLSVGSTGADVIALQTLLIANGFDIPSISSGAMAKGNFEAETEAAVRMYQISRGIPETGFVGPITRATLNACVPTTPPPVVCPLGYTCTPGEPTTPQVSGCPAHYICQPIQTNRPPIIISVTGPTSLYVGQPGTWTIVGSDPENGTLSYSTSWGDEKGIVAPPKIAGQSTTTSHSYATAGTFSPTFSVRDPGGASTSTTRTVVVTVRPPQDITPPTISQIGVSSITNIGARINWTTNEAATRQVQYGVTSNYGNAATLSDSSTTHSVPVTNLMPGIMYYYRVVSRDAAGNTSYSGNNTFTTLTSVPPVPTASTNPVATPTPTLTPTGTPVSSASANSNWLASLGAWWIGVTAR